MSTYGPSPGTAGAVLVQICSALLKHRILITTSYIIHDNAICPSINADLKHGYTGCEELVSMMVAGASDSSLSVRIPTAAAVAALSEALRAQRSEGVARVRLSDVAKSAHPALSNLDQSIMRS